MGLRRKDKGHGGGHGWYVTFADLMALLMAFFVMVAASSTIDKQKMAAALGSLREAFGVQAETRATGILEIDGIPTRSQVKERSRIPMEDSPGLPGPVEGTEDLTNSDLRENLGFSAAAPSPRQAWSAMPEIMELSEQIIVEDVPEGLNIQLIDQDGRSMFPPGSKYPYERTRVVLAGMAEALHDLPNRIVVTGHTNSDRSEEQAGYGIWELSTDRANAVRSILMGHGIAGDRFAAVTGKADVEPLFPEDSYLAANRRISILLLAEEPPLPPGHRP